MRHQTPPFQTIYASILLVVATIDWSVFVMVRSRYQSDVADPATQIILAKQRRDSVAAELPDRLLVGKVLAPRILKEEGVIKKLGELWKHISGVHVIDLSNNTFACVFPTKNKAEMVLDQALWFVMGHLLSLRPWGEGQISSDLNFAKEDGAVVSRRKKQKGRAGSEKEGYGVGVELNGPEGIQAHVHKEENSLMSPSSVMP